MCASDEHHEQNNQIIWLTVFKCVFFWGWGVGEGVLLLLGQEIGDPLTCFFPEKEGIRVG